MHGEKRDVFISYKRNLWVTPDKIFIMEGGTVQTCERKKKRSLPSLT